MIFVKWMCRTCPRVFSMKKVRLIGLTTSSQRLLVFDMKTTSTSPEVRYISKRNTAPIHPYRPNLSCCFWNMIGTVLSVPGDLYAENLLIAQLILFLDNYSFKRSSGSHSPSLVQNCFRISTISTSLEDLDHEPSDFLRRFGFLLRLSFWCFCWKQVLEEILIAFFSVPTCLRRSHRGLSRGCPSSCEETCMM